MIQNNNSGFEKKSLSLKKKLIYNTLLTVGIMVSVVMGKRTYDEKNYWLLGLCVLGAIFFIWKKIEITKEVKASLKAPKDNTNTKI